MRRILHILLLAAICLPCLAQTAQEELVVQLQTLQIQNMVLRREVDSLRRVLSYRKLTGEIEMSSLDSGNGVVNTWDLLLGGDGLMENTLTRTDYDDQMGSVYRQRLAVLDQSLLISYSPLLGEYIESYTIDRRRKMPSIIKRYEGYEDYFRKVFAEAGVPEDLTVLCIVESAVNPQAVSHMGAAGMWQIMPDTAVEYGLSVGLNKDERYDIAKSTAAAARILSAGYRFFGDWPLAVCAYNCGSGNVQRAIRQAGGRRDFWSIYEYLPKETRAYLPSFIAALYYIYYEQN